MKGYGVKGIEASIFIVSVVLSSYLIFMPSFLCYQFGLSLLDTFRTPVIFGLFALLLYILFHRWLMIKYVKRKRQFYFLDPLFYLPYHLDTCRSES